MAKKSSSGASRSSGRSSNDQRSDVHNPNSREHNAAADNRSNQMNPNNPAYRSSRSK